MSKTSNLRELKRHIRCQYTESWGDLQQTIYLFVCKKNGIIAKKTAKVRLPNGSIIKGDVYQNYDKLPENLQKRLLRYPMFENYDKLVTL